MSLLGGEPLSKLKLFSNGLIVKACHQTYEDYLGIEGDCWSIDEDTVGIEQQERLYLDNYCSEYLNLSWEDDNFVDVCPNIDFVNRYVSAYLKANIKFDVLFCETNKTRPNCHLNINNQSAECYILIGFDYAYSGGSFYSCVFSDIYSKRIPEFLDIELNKYGLINTEEELANFIRTRNKLSIDDEKGIFEKGNFTIYKLWRYVGDFPIGNG